MFVVSYWTATMAAMLRTALMAAAMTVMTVAEAVTVAVTVDSVAVRMGVPEGQGLSGVCLYRNGPDKRRHVMFKSVTSARKRSQQQQQQYDGGDYVVAGDLAADRVYEGTFVRLEDGDQVARFACKGGQRFEVATPFVVPDRDVDAMLAVKESMERRFGAQHQQPGPPPSRVRSVTADHVSVTLRGLRRQSDRQDAVTTVDVFQLYRKPSLAGRPSPPPDNAGNSSATVTIASRYSALPYARYVHVYTGHFHKRFLLGRILRQRNPSSSGGTRIFIL